jgi:hypothetical protein
LKYLIYPISAFQLSTGRSGTNCYRPIGTRLARAGRVNPTSFFFCQDAP